VKSRSWRIAGTLFAIAVVVRALYWLAAPPASASDSAEFLRAARAISAGDWSAVREYPFHAMYALLLAPAFVDGDHTRLYVPILHIALSAGAVVWLWAIARQVTADARGPFIAAAAGVVYPNLLFWMPYILTETAFVFFLLAFTYTLVVVVRHPTSSSMTWFVFLGVFLFFLRPVAVAVVLFGFVLVIARSLEGRTAGTHRWAAVAAAAIMASAAAFLLMNATVRERLIRIPTIGQTLWLSTTVVHGTAAEIAAARTPPEAANRSTAEQYAWKAHAAARFIRQHPVRYASMAAQRFVSFWEPSLYLDWSLRHRVLDAAMSTGLIVAAAVGLLGLGARSNAALLMAIVFLLSLESAFGQIDADARYRLPAETLLIPVAAAGVSRAIARAPQHRERRTEVST